LFDLAKSQLHGIRTNGGDDAPGEQPAGICARWAMLYWWKTPKHLYLETLDSPKIRRIDAHAPKAAHPQTSRLLEATRKIRGNGPNRGEEWSPGAGRGVSYPGAEEDEESPVSLGPPARAPAEGGGGGLGFGRQKPKP